METWAIILAAGAARRFQQPKQFVHLRGRRLVDRVVDTATRVCGHVVVVLPPGVPWDGPAAAAVVGGGATRSQSVRHGLAAVPPTARIIVIHDAAHPLADERLFTAVLEPVRRGALAAVPVLPLVEAIGRVNADHQLVDLASREGLRVLQTPQAFSAAALRAAHADLPEATEDSSLVARSGGVVRCVEGDPRNIHVITPRDIDAAALLAADCDRVPSDR